MSNDARTVRLSVNEDTLTINDLILLQDGGLKSPVQIRAFLSRFVVDEAGAPVGEEQARDMIGQMSLAQMKRALEDFGAQIKHMLDLSPTNATN